MAVRGKKGGFMSLLKEFLNGLQEGQNVWENYLVPLTDNDIDEFNNNSKYITIPHKKIAFSDLEKYFTLYSKIDNCLTAIVLDDNSTFARIKFIEILEECSTKIAKAKEEGKPYEDIKKLGYQFREGLKTLFCSMSIEDMRKIRESIGGLFDPHYKKGKMPLYEFLYDRSAEWLDEKLVMSDNVPNNLKQRFVNI